MSWSYSDFWQNSLGWRNHSFLATQQGVNGLLQSLICAKRDHPVFYGGTSSDNCEAFLSTTWGVSWVEPLEVAAPLLSVSAEVERVFRVTVQMKYSTQSFQTMAVGLSRYVGLRGTAGESFFYSAHIPILYCFSKDDSVVINFGLVTACFWLSKVRR